MFSKQTFDNNIYMKMFRWAYILLATNICLLLTNIPLFLTIICLAVDSRNIAAYMVSLLFLGGGSIAVFGVIDEFREQREVDPVKAFIRYFRKFGVKGFLYGLIGWLGVLVGMVDSIFFAQTSFGKWLIPLFILLAGITLAVTINACYFQVRNPESSIKAVVKMAGYYAVRKWYISLLNLALLSVLLLLMLLKPQFGFILTPGIFLGIIYLNNTKLHKIN